MSALSPIAPKIAKLIPRLATDHDGEIVATVQAIRRTLASSGLDLHDLAGALEREPETRTVIVYRDQGTGEPATWRALAEWCQRNDAGRLKAHERDFITDMAHRLVLNGKPTEKQATWLRTIYARLHREGAQ